MISVKKLIVLILKNHLRAPSSVKTHLDYKLAPPIHDKNRDKIVKKSQYGQKMTNFVKFTF